MTEKQKYYPVLAAKADFPKMESEILSFWDQDNTFQKSVQMRDGSPDFVFYDGPPFANGTPHYGHIMVSYVKDTVARFQTMLGKRVERRLGWDCHGLPAEMAAEKELGVSGHKAIMEYGIDKFNDFCRQDVLKYSGIWRHLFKRMGRWVDFDAEYKTMDLSFMESVLHNFKELYDKGLVYEDYRVQPYSWAAQSLLSNFELNQPGAYRDRTDTSITILFKLESGLNLLVWTTTPWTLPSNLMVAVGDDIDYVIMQEEDGEKYVLAEALVGRYKQQLQNATQVGTLKGRELVGQSYTPLYPYFASLKEKGCFKVLSGDFVSTEDGTGIVHIAPGFGADDFDVCRAYDAHFPIVCPVDNAGCFTDEVPDYAGRQVFDTNEDIIQKLKDRRILVKKEQITHSYPHCWRTDQPIIYRAMSGWFVKVTDLRDEMVELNRGITWVPDYIKDGRFGKWLEGARDWSISRNRFWGAPIPVWKSDNPAFPRVDVFGSIKDLETASHMEITDLHRPFIDTVVYPNPDDPSGKTMMRRIPDVFDCWFESGSMPEAQVHYPFENKEWFENHFPADFIVEALDQTRGWFYTLHVLGTALMHKPAFKSCVCTGLIMGEGGQKLSKRLKNYPDPDELLKTTGSDALRWFLLSSSVVSGGNVAIDAEGKEVTKAARKALIPLWNAFYFFCLYANAEGLHANMTKTGSDMLDTYILTKLGKLVKNVKEELEAYNLSKACEDVEVFLDILNNWYIRRSRIRFWDGSDTGAFDTLYTVLVTVCQAIAPLMPFMTDYIYKNLTGEESVHLQNYPAFDEFPNAKELVEQMDLVRAVSSVAKAIREQHKLRNRLPLQTLTLSGEKAHTLVDFKELLMDEVNVKDIILSDRFDDVATQFLYLKTPLIGKRLGAHMKDIMAASKGTDWAIQQDGTLKIADQILFQEEYEMRLVLKDGIAGAALPDNTAVVQLDVVVSPDLEKEGIARDFVRMVQDERKQQDFDVSDRIRLFYRTDSAQVKEALTQYADYIQSQVLASQFSFVPVLPEDTRVQNTEDGEIAFSLRKIEEE